VTFGALLIRRISFGGAISYWIAQLLGASIAAGVLFAAYHGGPAEAHLGAPMIAPDVSPMMAMLLEATMAFMLVIVIMGSVIDPRAPKGFGGLAVGLTLTANILFGGALTGASFNPARAFGPALIAGYWQDQWVYWVGPLLGGAIAALFYDRVLLERA
jgi:glycerol uptake facilitator-like aquaporin